MKALFRTIWLATLGALFSGGVLILGEGTASAGGRWCTLTGTWVNTVRGTTNNFQLTGLLIRYGDGFSSFNGDYTDGSYTATVSGTATGDNWSLSFVYTSGDSPNGQVKRAPGIEVDMEHAKDFKVEGTYTTEINGTDANKSGTYTISGTCPKS